MSRALLAQLTRIADALETLARAERRRPCRQCGQSGCEGHPTLPDVEGPFTAGPTAPLPAPLYGIGHAHQEISAAAALVVADEARAKRHQDRYLRRVGRD